jgi:acetyltransferase-like isoleucine patch superfamily enzyme
VNDERAKRWLRMCTAVGAHPHLTGRPTITSGGELRIGDRFRLASTPIPSHIAVNHGALLHIGNDVSIGCGAAIAAAENIQIGAGTRIGPFAIIMDTNFHGSPGDQSIQHDTRPVIIGAGCSIGTRVTITRGAIIGDGAEILAGSVVSSAIPPGVCAAGARARIIGRAGELTSRWDSAAAALPELLMEALGLESPPNLDSSPIAGHLGTEAQMHSLLRALEDRFGVRLQRASVGRMQSFTELAMAVEQALALSPLQAAADTLSLK